MKAGLRFFVLALAFLGSMSQSLAATKSTKYKTSASIQVCDDAKDAAVCLNTPQEAPETVILKNDTTKSVSSMVTESDLSGGGLSVENEALRDLAIEPIDTDLVPQSTALENAKKANDQIQQVEIFLRTASGNGGDLKVIAAGQK